MEGKMKIRMRHAIAGQHGIFPAGAEVDLAPELAEKFIQCGAAEMISMVAETAATTGAPETAARRKK